jgi:hypothetical protein
MRLKRENKINHFKCANIFKAYENMSKKYNINITFSFFKSCEKKVNLIKISINF